MTLQGIIEVLRRHKLNPFSVTTQVIKGKERQCCLFCGHCPDALADELEEVDVVEKEKQ